MTHFHVGKQELRPQPTSEADVGAMGRLERRGGPCFFVVPEKLRRQRGYKGRRNRVGVYGDMVAISIYIHI